MIVPNTWYVVEQVLLWNFFFCRVSLGKASVGIGNLDYDNRTIRADLMTSVAVPNLYFALILFLCAGLFGCMPNAIKEQQAFNQKHLEDNQRIQHIMVSDRGSPVHAALVLASVTESRSKAVVFIHGTPGDWQNAGRYLLDERLLESATVVSVDRPGWGESSVSDPEASLLFREQAIGIAAVLDALRSEMGIGHVILAGHSLGASIAPRVAMDFPELVDGMLLMAGSLDPQRGGPRWYNKFAALPGLSFILPEALNRSNREIMSLRKNLLSMKAGWATVSFPVQVIQGMEDKLVYPQNIDFIEAQLPNGNLTSVRLPNAGHLINLEQRSLVVTTLEHMLRQASL